MGIYEGPELNIRCREIADVVAKASSDNDLIKCLENASKRVRSYTFKSRFKGAGNILKKVERKRAEGASLAEIIEKDIRSTRGEERLAKLDGDLEIAKKLIAYGPDHVTDGWGCRYVTLYQNEIPTSVGSLLEALSAFNESGVTNPVRLKEFVVYTNRPLKDPLSIVHLTEQALERSKFPDSISIIREPENRKSAYSSVHLVFDRDVEIEHPGKPRAVELATFEIQVRDIFEEGWGEVQHHLLYGDRDTLPEQQPLASAPWQLHLNALKTFVDGCSQHASIIRMHFDASKRGPAPTNIAQSEAELERERTAVIQTLRRLGVSEDPLDLIRKAYALAEPNPSAKSGQKATKLLEASNYLKEAKEKIGNRILDERIFTDKLITVRYQLLLEEANARAAFSIATRPNNQEELEKAVSIYHTLVSKFVFDPIANFRLASALEMLNHEVANLQLALSHVDRCISLLNNDVVTGRDHWLGVSARVKRGYLLWLLAEQQSDQDPKLDLFEQAGLSSLQALVAWRAQSDLARLSEVNRLLAHKAASNVLFFGGELLLSGKSVPLLRAEVLEEHIQLIDDLGVEVYSDYFKTRDNLMRAHLALGQREKATGLALTNFRELRQLAEQKAEKPLDMDQVPAMLHGSEKLCFASARRVIFPDGGVDGEPLGN